jgi:hypothetical protein
MAWASDEANVGSVDIHTTSAGNQLMDRLMLEDIAAAPDLTPRARRLGPMGGAGSGVQPDADAVDRAARLDQTDQRYHHA